MWICYDNIEKGTKWKQNKVVRSKEKHNLKIQIKSCPTRSNIRTIKSRKSFPLKQNNVDLTDQEHQVVKTTLGGADDSANIIADSGADADVNGDVKWS